MSLNKAKQAALPSARPKKTVKLEKLSGGLNICDLEYHLPADQSPDMLNLWWDSGALCCRDGQVWLSSAATRGTGYAAYSELFFGYMFFHAGTNIWYADPYAETVTPVSIKSGVPQIKGTFFKYRGCLYYKTDGAYIKIKHTGNAQSLFSVETITPFVPTIMRRTDPTTYTGDEYQPENRLTGQKKVLYNAGYRVDSTGAKIGTLIYRLPERSVTSVDAVTVDGEAQSVGTDYNVNLTAGLVTFMTSPFDTVGIDDMENAVEIAYTKTNSDAYDSIMECTCASTYSVGDVSCIVMGGGETNKAAYFWSGIDDPEGDSYFPYDQTTVVDTADAITAFGKQQGLLIVFRENSIGKSEGAIKEANGRRKITLDYVTINAKIGCDMPDSVQLIENNLVFCSRRRGVYHISNTSTARENSILHISRNIDGGSRKSGLLSDLAAAGDAVSSHDDGRRYWLTANGSTYVWDHSISDSNSPSWFKLDGINAAAYISDGGQTFHMDASGRLTKFERCFYDYEPDTAIEKRYRFAVQSFDTYYQIKDVEDAVIALRPETESVVGLKYITDIGERTDKTPLVASTWKLAPRDLESRFLGVYRFAAIFKRRPYCKHIRHFTIELENSRAGENMSIISAEVIYRLRNNER